MIASRCFLTILEPVTSEATFCSSLTFQSMNSSISGWSTSTMTILAARRVVPPDLMAPAARSPILRKLIRPDERPPPDSFSPSPRSMREVRAGAGAVFEQARFTHPQIHDAALVDEVVLHALDEAGMRLRMLVGGLRLGQLAGEGVDIEVALARAVDAIGPVQAGVEPLRRIRRDALGGQHIGELVAEGARVVLRLEVAALPAPVGPGAGQPVEDLAGVDLGTVALGLPAAWRARPRRRRSATGRRGRRSPRPSSAARARRPCGNTSAPGCRRRPGRTAPAHRCCRGGTPPSHPDS